MKRLIAAGIVLFIALGLTLFCQINLNKISKNVKQQLSEITAEATAKKEGQTAQKFLKYWQEKENFLSLFINHEAVNEIGFSAAEMSAAEKQQNFEQVLESAREIEHSFRIISEDESFSIYSFF